MTDAPTQAAIPDVADLYAQYAAYEARAAELHAANKQSLCRALARAGIASVNVVFDGCGDSGQIEDMTATTAEGIACAFPDIAVEFLQLSFGDEMPRPHAQPLREAIETLSYALLADSHCGWGNDAGSYGEFTFDVAAETITLDYNERFESSEHYSHVF